MATITETTVQPGFNAEQPPTFVVQPPATKETAVQYPEAEWSATTVNYFKDAGAPPPDTANSTLSTHEMRIARRVDDSPHVAKTAVRVRNMRGREAAYRLDTHGFAVGRLDAPAMRDWHCDAELRRVYFPEVTALLRRQTGATHVFQYEWHVRTQTLEDSLRADSAGAVDIPGPVRRVHIDESPAEARREFEHYIQPGAEGHEHLRGRDFGIYNVWKPLKPVHKDPLCLCDARTVKDEDLQTGKVTVLNVGEIENFAVRPPTEEGRHEFVYLRGQQPDEALVFRIFDSRMDGGLHGSGDNGGKRSHGVPHTSFVDPGTENAAPRESVEVRSFCVF